MYSVKQLVSLFTDHFRKDEESNTYKLMQLFSDELQLLEETNNRIIEWRNIDKAEGKALDLIGQNVVQPRGTATDEVYRIMLKTKIARNLADGTLNGLITAIAYVLQVDKREIKVTEMWDLLNQPACIAVEAIPLDKIQQANITMNEFETILKSFVAAGVKILLMASGGNEYLKLYGQSYVFNVKYPICGRFRAGKVPGGTFEFEISLDTTAYTFDVKYPITSRINSGKVAGVLASTTTTNLTEAYEYELKRKVTSRFRTGQKGV